MWRAKYSPIGRSTARSTSSGAWFGDHSSQSCDSSADASTPSSATAFVMSWSDGTRALPPRSPNDTQPSMVGQISRVRPMCAPRRLPRKRVCSKRAGEAMFATLTHSCIDRSTRRPPPVQSALSTANAISPPVWP